MPSCHTNLVRCRHFRVAPDLSDIAYPRELHILGNTCKDAEVFYHRAYSGYRKTLGEKHPTTAACSRHYSSMLKEEKG